MSIFEKSKKVLKKGLKVECSEHNALNFIFSIKKIMTIKFIINV